MTHHLQIKQSTTGKYHLGYTGSTGPTCNHNMRTRGIKTSSVLGLGSHRFCDKCFSIEDPKSHIERLIADGLLEA